MRHLRALVLGPPQPSRHPTLRENRDQLGGVRLTAVRAVVDVERLRDGRGLSAAPRTRDDLPDRDARHAALRHLLMAATLRATMCGSTPPVQRHRLAFIVGE